MRLLVVEDDTNIREFLRRALIEAGYHVDTAGNAKDGEAKALEGIHDAFIVDLGLPDRDGWTSLPDAAPKVAAHRC